MKVTMQQCDLISHDTKQPVEAVIFFDGAEDHVIELPAVEISETCGPREQTLSSLCETPKSHAQNVLDPSVCSSQPFKPSAQAYILCDETLESYQKSFPDHFACTKQLTQFTNRINQRTFLNHKLTSTLTNYYNAWTATFSQLKNKILYLSYLNNPSPCSTRHTLHPSPFGRRLRKYFLNPNENSYIALAKPSYPLCRGHHGLLCPPSFHFLTLPKAYSQDRIKQDIALHFIPSKSTWDPTFSKLSVQVILVKYSGFKMIGAIRGSGKDRRDLAFFVALRVAQRFLDALSYFLKIGEPLEVEISDVSTAHESLSTHLPWQNDMFTGHSHLRSDHPLRSSGSLLSPSFQTKHQTSNESFAHRTKSSHKRSHKLGLHAHNSLCWTAREISPLCQRTSTDSFHHSQKSPLDKSVTTDMFSECYSSASRSGESYHILKKFLSYNFTTDLQRNPWMMFSKRYDTPVQTNTYGLSGDSCQNNLHLPLRISLQKRKSCDLDIKGRFPPTVFSAEKMEALLINIVNGVHHDLQSYLPIKSRISGASVTLILVQELNALLSLAQLGNIRVVLAKEISSSKPEHFTFGSRRFQAIELTQNHTSSNHTERRRFEQTNCKFKATHQHCLEDLFLLKHRMKHQKVNHYKNNITDLKKPSNLLLTNKDYSAKNRIRHPEQLFFEKTPSMIEFPIAPNRHISVDVTRSVGFTRLSLLGLSCVPDIADAKLPVDETSFLIVGTSRVWEVFRTPQDIIDFLAFHLVVQKKTFEEATKALSEEISSFSFFAHCPSAEDHFVAVIPLGKHTTLSHLDSV